MKNIKVQEIKILKNIKVNQEITIWKIIKVKDNKILNNIIRIKDKIQKLVINTILKLKILVGLMKLVGVK